MQVLCPHVVTFVVWCNSRVAVCTARVRALRGAPYTDASAIAITMFAIDSHTEDYQKRFSTCM